MPATSPPPPLGWAGIARLGLVQAALGAVVVLATGTLNRLMVVEMGLPALVPGLLIAWHYLIQVLRPRLGHGSDLGGRRTPWIIGGVAVLALGAFGAAAGTLMMRAHPLLALALAWAGYSAIGLGVGCAGTSLLVLLAQRTAPQRRPAAATLVWIMMIAGFVLTAVCAGLWLEPYSARRLLQVVAAVGTGALLLTVLAVWGVEIPCAVAAPPQPHPPPDPRGSHKPERPGGFAQALREVWREPQARRFAGFVFVAMLAYSAQELLLDPFAGAVYGYSPGASTRLSGLQHGGALAGMLLVAALGSVLRGRGAGSPRRSTMAGCAASALMLLLIAAAASARLDWSLRALVFGLGVANGAFAVSAVAAMMQMVGQGTRSREGVRMGLWGAAQAVAFAGGGLFATGLSDLARQLWTEPAHAYALVFTLQAGLFLVAAALAHRLWKTDRPAAVGGAFGAERPTNRLDRELCTGGSAHGAPGHS